MQPPSLNDLTRSHSAFDGQVIFHMLTFTPLAVRSQREALQRIKPRILYIHKDTGETRTEVPEEYESAVQLALEMKTPVDSEWRAEPQWGGVETTFTVVVPTTEWIEFHLREDAPTELRALERFWNHRNGSAEHNFQLMERCVGENALAEWNLAWGATRDHSMDAPEAIQKGEPDKAKDPLAGKSGKPDKRQSATTSNDG